MIRSYLEYFGHKILEAGDAMTAAQVSATATLEAIILDATLPGEGSLKLFGLLKEKHPVTPVIIYTGRHEEDAMVKELLRNGARTYLLKDGSLEKLLAAVREATD